MAIDPEVVETHMVSNYLKLYIHISLDRIENAWRLSCKPLLGGERIPPFRAVVVGGYSWPGRGSGLYGLN